MYKLSSPVRVKITRLDCEHKHQGTLQPRQWIMRTLCLSAHCLGEGIHTDFLCTKYQYWFRSPPLSVAHNECWHCLQQVLLAGWTYSSILHKKAASYTSQLHTQVTTDLVVHLPVLNIVFIINYFAIERGEIRWQNTSFSYFLLDIPYCISHCNCCYLFPVNIFYDSEIYRPVIQEMITLAEGWMQPFGQVQAWHKQD